jgi:hypothetical protein
MFEAERTGGNFSTEEEAAAHLDSLLATTSELFAVTSEVSGTRQYSRPQQQQTGVRIDRILFPKKKLLDAGWRSGVVGIEIKKSGHPAGPLVAQAEDYMQSVFTFDSGVSVCLNSVYLFPSFCAAGVAASILSQRRIGFAGDHKGRLSLTLNNTCLLRYAFDGEVRVGTSSQLNCGMKVGSR